MVGFVLEEGRREPVPKECHLVVDGPKILGRVSSARYSPALNRVIGLASVPPTLGEPGSELQIKIEGGQRVTGTVVKLPFYDPENTRQHPDRAGGEEK